MDQGFVVFIIAIQLAFLAFLIFIAAHYRQKTLSRRSEERLRVLDRFSSGQELSDFLATERGQHFLELFAAKATNPLRIIVVGIGLALILAFMGAAFLLLSWLDAQQLGRVRRPAVDSADRALLAKHGLEPGTAAAPDTAVHPVETSS